MFLKMILTILTIFSISAQAAPSGSFASSYSDISSLSAQDFSRVNDMYYRTSHNFFDNAVKGQTPGFVGENRFYKEFLRDKKPRVMAQMQATSKYMKALNLQISNHVKAISFFKSNTNENFFKAGNTTFSRMGFEDYVKDLEKYTKQLRKLEAGVITLNSNFEGIRQRIKKPKYFNHVIALRESIRKCGGDCIIHIKKGSGYVRTAPSEKSISRLIKAKNSRVGYAAGVRVRGRILKALGAVAK